MEKSDFVIIGGVAAGPKTAAVLARRLPDAKISVFQKEEHISYGTCGLPYFASGDINSFDELTKTSYGVVRSPEFFRNSKGFDVLTEHEVLSINRENKTIQVKNLKTDEIFEYGYGKLVLATGANPNKPSFPVIDNPRIKPFTRPPDAVNFRKMAQTGRIESAVIIGGGFIGCELAEAAGGLWGINVTLIEKEKQLLPYVLDPEMASIVSREMKRNDIDILTGCEVKQIDVNDKGKPIVKITNSKDIITDYVFLCFGVHPETALAKNCDLELGQTGGIKVNEFLQTSDENIYAGGDCVESVHQITNQPDYMPMGSLANRHGWIIAENLTGGNRKFTGVVGAFLVKVFDINVGSAGLSEKAAKNAGLITKAVWGSFPDKPDYYPESKTFSLKMIYDGNNKTLLGLQAVGQGDICRRVDVFSSFLQHKASIHELLEYEHGYAPPYSEAIDPLFHLATMANAQEQGVNFVNPGSDFTKTSDNLIWLDVREHEEAETESWPFVEKKDIINIPLNDLKNSLDELDRNKKIMLICRRGPRSYQASIILKKAGYKDISIIGGGTTAAIN